MSLSTTTPHTMPRLCQAKALVCRPYIVFLRHRRQPRPTDTCHSCVEQPISRRQVAKGIREGAPRENSKTDRRHPVVRRPDVSPTNRYSISVQEGGLTQNPSSVLYKSESDVMLYLVGSVEENEVLLYNAILALRDSLHLLFKASVDKRTIIESYDLVSLAVDEIVDDGIILETDPTIIVQRVSKAPTADVDLRRIDPFSEQGVNHLAQLGKNKLTDWLRQGL